MKNSTIIAIVIVIAALGIWYFVSQREAVTPVIPVPEIVVEDTTESLNADIQNIEIGDTDRDIRSLESDIRGL